MSGILDLKIDHGELHQAIRRFGELETSPRSSGDLKEKVAKRRSRRERGERLQVREHGTQREEGREKFEGRRKIPLMAERIKKNPLPNVPVNNMFAILGVDESLDWEVEEERRPSVVKFSMTDETLLFGRKTTVEKLLQLVAPTKHLSKSWREKKHHYNDTTKEGVLEGFS